MILFSNRGLDWMYRKQILDRADELLNEKEKRRYDRHVRGGTFFLTGLIITIGAILVAVLY